MESKRPGVACYWNTSEVKEEKVNVKMKHERVNKENYQTMKLKKQNKEN